MSGAAALRHPPVRPDWLARRPETALEPDLPIIDAHHHLRNRPGDVYLRADFLEDAGQGHDIRASVAVECMAHFFPDGEPLLRPVGETHFLREQGAGTQVAAAIVGYADLTAGAAIRPVLEAHVAAGQGRFRGIRQIAAHHPDPAARGSTGTPPPMLLLDPAFRAGFSQLAPLGLSFEAWIYHTQLAELRDLADAFPDTRIVLNHVGGALGIGPYATRGRHVRAAWGAALRELSHCPNLSIKLGGMGMRLFGFGFHEQQDPPGSEQLAEAWRPYVETCVEAFGAERCMFESNFPVDKGSCGYVPLWNAFKRISRGWNPAERANAFHDTAARFYRL
ncbi:amidohydrolase family protein [Teichococcus deserti]|uniref:amidohydrolase family protein n=1 Tax=Teichococcus deserti TaxID=1817963 RepID=UPI0009F93A4B|nr:amidohydrolase family protein [Pseudoroseomonas deserti]